MPVGLHKDLVKAFIKNSIKLSSYATSILESSECISSNSITLHNLREIISSELPYWSKQILHMKENSYTYVANASEDSTSKITISKLVTMLALHIKMLNILKLNNLSSEYCGDSLVQLIDDRMLGYSENSCTPSELFPNKYRQELYKFLKAQSESLSEKLSSQTNSVSTSQIDLSKATASSPLQRERKECFGVNIRYIKMAKWSLSQVYRIVSQHKLFSHIDYTPSFMRNGNLNKFLLDFSQYLNNLEKGAVQWRRSRLEMLRFQSNSSQLYCICAGRKELERLVASKSIVDFIVLWFTGNWLTAKQKMGKGDVVSFTQNFFNNHSSSSVASGPSAYELDPGTIKRLFSSAASQIQVILEEITSNYKMPGIGTKNLPISLLQYMTGNGFYVIEVSGKIMETTGNIVVEEEKLKEVVGQYGQQLWSKLENACEHDDAKSKFTPIDLAFLREWGILQNSKRVFSKTHMPSEITKDLPCNLALDAKANGQPTINNENEAVTIRPLSSSANAEKPYFIIERLSAYLVTVGILSIPIQDILLASHANLSHFNAPIRLGILILMIALGCIITFRGISNNPIKQIEL